MNRRTFLRTGALAAALPLAARPATPPSPTSDAAATAWGGDDLRKLGIWDVHSHVTTVGPTPAKRMEALLAIADRVGVERLCICMSPPWTYEPTPEQFRKSNDDVIEILKTWSSRVFGFVYLNPKYTKESLAELERCVADGPMIGIKLWVGTHCNRPELDPIVHRAAELNALILQHTWIKQRGKGNLPQESTPMELAELSARHPGVPLVCGHTGGGDWALGVRAIRAQPDVYADLGGGDPVYGEVEMAVRELGASRVLYGSDVAGRSFASQIGRVLGADISVADKKLILRENLRRLLLPALQRKGIKT
ncbi:MAG: amidohydrolase family protein [Verrucomicrobia bacterium]|nr:amidohydrolase family protein [Verrucomicrobiota bacterium]